MMHKINETVEFLQKKGISSPFIGIVLGTGLNKLVDFINIECVVDYKEIPNFPESHVKYHKGQLIYGTLEGKKVLAMQGRYHFYEGYSLQEVTFPIRVMKLLGIEYLLLSNAAGSVNPAFKKGTLMLIDDHINLLPGNPLTGPNIDELGPRYPEMSQPYAALLNKKLEKIAQEKHITLHKGVFVAVLGPNLETRAEYRYLRNIGADAVGMSTIPEVIVARHMSLPCCAISALTDEGDPDNLEVVEMDEILKYAAMAEEGLITLYTSLIKEL